MIRALGLGDRRRFEWKWRLLFFLFVFVVFLLLFARIPFMVGGVLSVLTSMLSVVPTILLGLAPVVVGTVLFVAMVILVHRRWGWGVVAEQLFSSHRRIYVVSLVPSATNDALSINIEKDRRGGRESFVMSALRLLSVPSEGVRQRVRGAVSEEESEESAVSDEKQYQFSHLASLYEKEGGNLARSYELHFKKGLVNVMFAVSGNNPQECRSRREQVRASILSKFPIQLTEEKNSEQLRGVAMLGLLTKNNGMGNIGDEDDDEQEEESYLEEGEGGDSRVALRGYGAEMVMVNVETVNDMVARVETRGGWVTRRQPPRYVSVVVLEGRPEMSAHEQRSQIDHLIAGINTLTGRGNGHLDAERLRRHRVEEEVREEDEDIVFIVSFQSSTPPKYPSDALLREKLREKPEVKLSLERKRVEVDAMEVEFGRRVGWWKVSTYAVVAGRNAAEVEEKAKMVMRVIRGVWSGSHFSPDCAFLHSKEVVNNFNQILKRSLMKRYVTEMSSVRLSSLVHLPEEPHPPLTRATPPLFEAPDPKILSNCGNAAGSSSGVVEFGEVQGVSGGGLYKLALPLNSLGKHMSVFGESGSGKTCLVINLLRQVQQKELTAGVSFLVLDQKGEYRSLVPSLKDQGALGVVYFVPASHLAPLKINLFDPQGDRPESHVKQLFGIIREVLFSSGRTELSPQMERVFYDVLELNVGGDWSTFREKLDEYVKTHGAVLPQVDATVQAIMNRVGSFTRPPLSYVFNCKKSNVNFGYLTERNVVIDLSELRRQGAPEDVRLVANVIAKYVSSASLSRGASHGGELRHLFVVDDALDLVPEILSKKTTAEVGLIEFMAMLLRATGQGLIVVSQRPNVSQNVIGNSDIKVFFRTVVDAREVAAWLNLNEEQTAYLKMLPPREAIIAAPAHLTPLRVRTPDINKVVRRKVSDEDIIINNMVHYPIIYDNETTNGRSELATRRIEKKDTAITNAAHIEVKRLKTIAEEACQAGDYKEALKTYSKAIEAMRSNQGAKEMAQRGLIEHQKALGTYPKPALSRDQMESIRQASSAGNHAPTPASHHLRVTSKQQDKRMPQPRKQITPNLNDQSPPAHKREQKQPQLKQAFKHPQEIIDETTFKTRLNIETTQQLEEQITTLIATNLIGEITAPNYKGIEPPTTKLYYQITDHQTRDVLQEHITTTLYKDLQTKGIITTWIDPNMELLSATNNNNQNQYIITAWTHNTMDQTTTLTRLQAIRQQLQDEQIKELIIVLPWRNEAEKLRKLIKHLRLQGITPIPFNEDETNKLINHITYGSPIAA